MKKFPWACVALTALSLYSSSLLAANFSASFKNTDIREFIDTVGRNLNKTILVDPSVQGTVSVRTYNVLTEDRVLPILSERAGSLRPVGDPVGQRHGQSGALKRGAYRRCAAGRQQEPGQR